MFYGLEMLGYALRFLGSLAGLWLEQTITGPASKRLDGYHGSCKSAAAVYRQWRILGLGRMSSVNLWSADHRWPAKRNQVESFHLQGQNILFMDK
jgi:hypothetical protein